MDFIGTRYKAFCLKIWILTIIRTSKPGCRVARVDFFGQKKVEFKRFASKFGHFVA